MDKMCLALYDVTGIQQFIFSSNRAKENIGASVYVRRILDGELRKILGSVGDKTADFEQQPDKLQITANNQLQSEIIYIGGGNAMVLYRNRDLAIAATRELARRILLDTRNTLGLAVAYVDTSLKNFCNDQRQLRLQIDKCKASQPRSEPLGGIAVTIECADGLPACGAKGKKAEFISNPANNKLENAKDNIFKHLIPDKREFPMEFDELGGEKGEQSQIAVVHIDGNGMGAFIKQAVESVAEKGYDSAVAAMRRLSKEIQAAYEQVFRDVCVELDNAMQSVDVRETIKSKKNFLPIRPLILSGDDTTFVCDGRIGLQLTARFLELLAQRKIDGTALSACAGIAITGSHFPFHRAYSLAEALCEVETDKATFEVESPASGTVLGIFYPDDADVEVLKVIAAIGEPGEDVSALRPETSSEDSEQKTEDS